MKIINPIKKFFQKLFGRSRREDSEVSSPLPDGSPQDAAELSSEDYVWLEGGEAEGSATGGSSNQIGLNENPLPEPT